MITRIALLFSITLIMKLTAPLFTVFRVEISGRDILLILGGLFLLAKSTLEIHSNLEGEEAHAEEGVKRAKVTFGGVIVQIMLLDIVFSLDSVITAIGLAQQLAVMVAAIVIAVIVMMLVSGKISNFVDRHPTIKILALSFLLLIGFALVGEGFDLHIPKKPRNWFCCRATWGGFHVWERGSARLIAWGKTPWLAWKAALSWEGEP